MVKVKDIASEMFNMKTKDRSLLIQVCEFIKRNRSRRMVKLCIKTIK